MSEETKAAPSNPAESMGLLSAKDEVIAAARCIRHWHDTSNGGMIVSGTHVRLLWAALAKLNELRVDNAKVNRPEEAKEKNDG